MYKFAGLALCTLSVVSIVNPIQALAQNAPSQDVTITYELENSALLQAEGSPSINITDHNDIVRSIAGTEKSQCQDYGRQSSGSVSVSSQASLSGSNAVSGNMHAQALAMGGHYRTCAVPCDIVNNICVGIEGHDTQAVVSGSAHLRARIAFGSQIIQDTFDINFFFSHPEEFQVQLTKPDGTTISIDKAQRAVRVVASRSDVFYVDAELAAAATNKGGCCSDTKDVSAQFDIKVERAPLLQANAKVEPYIVGGKQTSSYKYVVAIMLGGAIHCSGTVIAKRTILTAAHCIHGFEQQIKDGRMTYVVGQSAMSPDVGPLPIADGTYPKGSDPILYNPISYIHDVGLLFTSADITGGIAQLHVDQPTWADIEKQSLLFVGYGYNEASNGDFVGLGIKREANWKPSDADDWRFYYSSTNKHACQGDSGGPAFYMLEETRELLLVGVTSVGDKNCTGIGADTRMDVHHSWVAAHLK